MIDAMIQLPSIPWELRWLFGSFVIAICRIAHCGLGIRPARADTSNGMIDIIPTLRQWQVAFAIFRKWNRNKDHAGARAGTPARYHST